MTTRALHYLLASAAAVLAGACSYTDLISASSDEKRVAFEANRDRWKADARPGSFGRERSVQVFQGDKIKLTAKGLKVRGGMGMASLLTPDGYALTAAHVVSGSPELDTVLTLRDNNSVPVHIQWAPLNVTASGEVGGAKGERLQMFAYTPEMRRVRAPDVNIAKLRVVKVFPFSDLALVKLPVGASRWFETRDPSLPVDTRLFASGNGATPYHGTSAGQVVSVQPSPGGVKRVHTSVPLASGDSGGPVFDTDGKLVGVVSHVRASKLFPWPTMNHSSLRMTSPQTLQELIEADRRRHPPG